MDGLGDYTSHTKYMKGTCTAMCPKQEILLREKERLLHRFEIKSGTENDKLPRADHDKVIKSYSRSAAGHKVVPSDLRPFPVLLKTIKYLFHEIFPLHKSNPVTVYDFMFDRLRSIRQDMVIQNLTPQETIRILEPIVRFHIYFGYYLVEEDEKIFDQFINNTHLQECLKRLLVCYDESETDLVQSMLGMSLNGKHLNNRYEIEAAYLLFNLCHFEAMSRGVKLVNEYVIKEVLRLTFAWYGKNFVRVFQLLKNLPPLLLCVVSIYIPEIRKSSLKIYSHAFSCSNCAYPVSHLKDLLLYENEAQLIEDCQHFNIKIVGDNVSFSKKDFNESAGIIKLKKISWLDKQLLNCDLVKLLCYGSE